MSDPFELLQKLDDHHNDRDLPVGVDPSADTLLAKILASPIPTIDSPSARPHRRPWPRRTAIGLGIVLIAGAGTVAALSWRESDPTVTATVACYSDASATPMVQIAVAADPSLTPLAQCTTSWLDGSISTGGAPHLVECVTTEGLVAVMPGSSETCAGLGLTVKAEQSPEQRSERAGVIALQETLSNEFDDVCLTADEAQAVVQIALDEQALSDWTIALGVPLDEVRKCAAPAIDEPAHTVMIIGVVPV